jgi:hypothetical protein
MVSNRRKANLSSIVLLLAVAGCPDPQKRFEQFEDRIPDAAPNVVIDSAPLSELPDVTGTFLLGLAVSLNPDAPIRFLVDVTLEQHVDGTGLLDLEFTPLHKTTIEPLAGAPIVINDVAVNTAGDFQIHVDTIIISGDANTITGAEIEVQPLDLFGSLKNADLFCGYAEGAVKRPSVFNLEDGDGTSWAAIRVTPGDTGTDLPPVVGRCPAPVLIDAGVVDAAVDAGAPIADAAASIDATPVDASGPDVAP